MTLRDEWNERLHGLGKDVREAGRHVWLAGLGAVGTLEERGRTVFSDLVDRGERLDGKLDLEVLKPFEEAADRVKSFSQRLERQVEDGMSEALHRLGMPARGDVQALIDRVDTLSEKVDTLAARN